MGSSEDSPQTVHFGVMAFAEDGINPNPTPKELGSPCSATMAGTAGVFSVSHWCPLSLSQEFDSSWSSTHTSVSCLLGGCSAQPREIFLSLPAQALLVCVTNWVNSRQRGLEKRSLLPCFPGLWSGEGVTFWGFSRGISCSPRGWAGWHSLGHTPAPWENTSWKRRDLF